MNLITKRGEAFGDHNSAEGLVVNWGEIFDDPDAAVIRDKGGRLISKVVNLDENEADHQGIRIAVYAELAAHYTKMIVQEVKDEAQS